MYRTHHCCMYCRDTLPFHRTLVYRSICYRRSKTSHVRKRTTTFLAYIQSLASNARSISRSLCSFDRIHSTTILQKRETCCIDRPTVLAIVIVPLVDSLSSETKHLELSRRCGYLINPSVKYYITIDKGPTYHLTVLETLRQLLLNVAFARSPAGLAATLFA